MKVLFLSPHFPSNLFLFCSNLKRLGANVFGLAEEQYGLLSLQLRESLTDYWRVDSMENWDEVVSAFRELRARYGEDNWRIESMNEHWLGLESHLREQFGIPGYKSEDLKRIKQKSGMKELYCSVNIPVARGKVLNSLTDVLEFVQEVGYPIVAKPDIGVGAADTHKIKNEEELRTFFSNPKNKPFIFEEFLEGDIESFDGLTDQNGNIVFFTSHKFSSGIMEVVTEDNELSYYSERQIPEDLKDYGHKVIKASGLKEKFFHLEFFRLKKNGKLVALEMNMRPPGGYTLDMFNFANDIDLYYEWASIVVRNEFGASHYSRPYHVCYVGRKDRYEYAHQHHEVTARFGSKIQIHAPMPSIFQKVMGSYFYIFRTTELEEMRQILAFIQRRADKSSDS